METSYPEPGERGGSICSWAYLGHIGYVEAWDLQRSLAMARAGGKIGDVLLLLEHPPTYTLGRRSKESDLLLSRKELEAQGAMVMDIDRGGEITFHGPGQLVGYAIIDLRSWGSPLKYVRALEAVLVDTLDVFSIRASRIEGLTGVWAKGAKVGAIGVRVSRGVTTHGFALNVTTDLSWFQNVVPCGIRDRNVSSMEQLGALAIPLKEVAQVVAQRFGNELGFTMKEVASGEAVAVGTPALSA